MIVPMIRPLLQRKQPLIGDRVSAGLGYSVDVLSGKPVPANAAEWAKFITKFSLPIAVPDALYGFQETTGDIVDLIGSRTLTANVAPAYSGTVTGWTRLGVVFNGTTNQRCAHTTFANAATTSILSIMYRQEGATPGATTNIYGYGTSNIAAGLTRLSTDRIRYRNGGTIVDFAADSPGASPLVFKHDVTNSVARAMDLVQKLSPAFVAAAGTRFDVGATTGASDNMTVFYQPVWLGAAAEAFTDAITKTVLQALGWAPGWT